MIRRRHLSRPLSALAALCVVTATVSLGAGHAAAQGFENYTMTASANTVTVEINDANAPLLAPQLLAASPGSAQAQLNSFGISTAYAGAPFLGQTIEGVGGLVNGLGYGVLPPLPATLPGYVSTTNPSEPTASASQGPYTLEAQSGDTSSSAQASIAATNEPTALSSSATAVTAVESDGTVESTAQAITQPLSVDSLVQIGTVLATATMTENANGQLTESSSLDMGSITVAGIKVGITQSGLQLVPGLDLPLVNLSTLNALLSSAGITIQLLPGSKTATSITSEGLQISQTFDAPIEGESGVVLILGQANAQLQAEPSTETPATTPSTTNSGAHTTQLTPAPVNNSSSTVTSTPAPSGVTPSPVSSGVTNSPASTPPSTQPSTTPSLATGTTRESESTPSSEYTPDDRSILPSAAQLAERLGPDGLRFYLILLAAGLAFTAASRAATVLAVRTTRTRLKKTP